MFYRLLKHLVGICFNLLNFALAGNLPPLGCVTVIVEEQGRYLLIKRPHGKLSFPSGFIRWREMPIQAAKRECFEETGLRLQIEPEDLITCYAHIGQHIDTLSTLTLVYGGKVTGGRLRGSIEGQAYWLEEQEMRKGLERRSEYLLVDYLQFRARRAAMHDSAENSHESAKEGLHDSNIESPVRREG